ncbi:MAG: hypothetical protein ACRD2G_19490, partial [Terriglobia bacterium]
RRVSSKPQRRASNSGAEQKRIYKRRRLAAETIENKARRRGRRRYNRSCHTDTKARRTKDLTME